MQCANVGSDEVCNTITILTKNRSAAMVHSSDHHASTKDMVRLGVGVEWRWEQGIRDGKGGGWGGKENRVGKRWWGRGGEEVNMDEAS